MLTNIYLLVVALFAYFVKGITGFGNTLVIASLFSFVISPKLITPVDLLVSIPTNSFLVWKDRKNINIKIVLPLSLMLLLGVIPGTLLLKAGNDRALKCLLGLVVIGIGIEMLSRNSKAKAAKAKATKGNPAFLFFIGVLSGVLAGLFSISAPLIAYINRTTQNRNQFRANLCCVFLVDNLFRLFYYLSVGIISVQAVKLALLLSPSIVAGMFIGVKVDTGLKEETVKKAVVALLIASGSILILTNLFFK